MSQCVKCGSTLPAGAKFCGTCGATQPVAAAQPQTQPQQAAPQYAAPQSQFQNQYGQPYQAYDQQQTYGQQQAYGQQQYQTYESAPVVKDNRVALATCCYWGLIAAIIAACKCDRSDKYVLQHVNQALFLNIIAVVSAFLCVLIIGIITGITAFVFIIIGSVRASGGSAEPLPLVGGIQLIK